MSQNRNGLLATAATGIGIIIVASFSYLYFVHDNRIQPEKGMTPKYKEEDKNGHFSFNGPTGTLDRAAAQRGYQVYKEVCSACHGMSRVSFRQLQSIGFSEAEVKELAKGYQYSTTNDAGETVTRPGAPSDPLPSPYPNEQASRAANGGAYPPDLSLIAKARHDGPNYVYSLLTGYEEAPADVKMTDGKYYNPYFEGRQISMPKVLSAGAVTYADGTEASADQMAHDVVTYLQWAAEPEMEARKRMGIKVIAFLAFLTGFFLISKRRIWSRVKH